MTAVATFNIEKVQYLDEQCNLTQPLPEFSQDKAHLLKLYRTMNLIRTFDNKAVALQRTGKMGTYAPIFGQEAISTAMGDAMEKDDVLVPYYRDYAAQYLRGTKLSEIYQYWGGDERGNRYADNAEDLPICVPIASQCLHAAGIASSFKYRNQKRVAVVALGEGGTSEGDFYEALNLAGAWHLPFVCIVNSNGWAISVPRSKQTACKTIAQKAIAAGIKGIQVDGNDIFATREVIGKAINEARRGYGPTLVECLSYRLCDHTTADDASRYQEAEEVQKAKTREPLARFRTFLENQGYWGPEAQKQLDEECAKLVANEVEQYLNLEKAPVSDMFDYHYHTLPPELEEQRKQAIQEDSDHA